MNLHVFNMFLQDFYMFHINLHVFYMFLHIFYKTLQVNLIIYFILVCVVMVQVSYIPRCRVMRDLHSRGPNTLVCNLYIIIIDILVIMSLVLLL